MSGGHDHHGHDHPGHDHGDHTHGDHGHGADDHAAIEEVDYPATRFEVLEQAIRELLIEKNVVSAADINRQIDDTDSRTPANGGRVVARAWTDPAFREWLLRDARAAVESLGLDLLNGPGLAAVENTPDVRHVVVCTLCSCYPRKLLGIPPAWYKSRSYRSRVVVDPRGVLAEFGDVVPEDVQIRVVDSTADLRYIVIPERPPGTEGMSEADLAALVTRDSLIGVAPARTPGPTPVQVQPD